MTDLVRTLARLRARPAEALARRRVPLGFFVGAIAIWLARPTWRSLAAGAALACVGEAVRVWAAGHLEKGREVTTSGPYRWVRHPLYLGSSLMGIGFVVAASSLPVAILVLGYLVATLSAAMRSEERWLQERFGAAYDDYCAGRMRPTDRQFELSRVVANRELRAVMGLLVIIAVLALKAQ